METKTNTLNDGTPKLIIIVGPTGVGKTELAIKLATLYGGEIISADSMQVYRYMDIGTAKPSFEEMRAIRHHLIGIVNPDEKFNAALFIEKAHSVIEQLQATGTRIFVVGGTGLYIRALLGGLFEGPGALNELRESYMRDLQNFGSEYLYRKLQKTDRMAAGQIHPHDTVRIMRALEVYESTGKSIITHQDVHRFGEQKYEYIALGLTMNRSLLYERTDARVDRMIKCGLVDEVAHLLEMGYDVTLKPMQSMCYRYIVDYLSGFRDINDAIHNIKRDTRHYAKRQLTWFNKDANIRWFHPDDTSSIRNELNGFLHIGCSQCMVP